MPRPEFPITFDLTFEGRTLSSHRARTAEEMRTILAAARKVHDPRVEIGNFDEYEPELADVPELVALRLATVYCDGSTSLVSLAHRYVLMADNDDAGGEYANLLDMVPHVRLTGEMEKAASDEYFNDPPAGDDDNDYEDGFPGWPAVCAYLDNHPEVFNAVTGDTGERDGDDEENDGD